MENFLPVFSYGAGFPGFPGFLLELVISGLLLSLFRVSLGLFPGCGFFFSGFGDFSALFSISGPHLAADHAVWPWFWESESEGSRYRQSEEGRRVSNL